MLRVTLTVIFIVVCLAMIILVLLQEGKTAGLGAVSGSEETYWGKNKERSTEGKVKRATKYVAIAFIVLAAILNITRF